MLRDLLAAEHWPSYWERTVWFVWAMFIVVLGTRPLWMPNTHNVYPIYARAAHDWSAGKTMYGLANRSSDMDQFRYAPVFALSMVPFVALAGAWGEMAWRFLGAFCYLAGFVCFAREFLPDVWQSRWRRPTLLLLVLPLSIGSLNNGQMNVLLLGMLLLALTAASRQRWNLAALCLTVSILCKLYPLALALLLVVRYPRELGWRVLLFLGLGLALPFAAQTPAYVVGEYRHWAAMLGGDDRRDLLPGHGYHDLDLLLNVTGLRLGRTAYLGVQLGAVLALACLAWARRRDGSRAQLRVLFDLCCCWMILLGPATESSTYILLAPTLAAGFVETWTIENRYMCASHGLAYVLLTLSVIGTGLAAPKAWMGVFQVVGALVLTVGRLAAAVENSVIRDVRRFAPSPCTPHPQPLSPEYRGEGRDSRGAPAC